MSNLSYDYISQKGTVRTTLFAIFLVLSSSCAILVGFLWRDIFFGLLKRYDLYDNDEGFEKGGFKWGLGIAVVATVLAAVLSVMSVKYGAASVSK